MPPPAQLFVVVRQVVCFLLGVALLIDTVVGHTVNVAELVAGLLLVGILPIDALRLRK